MARALGSGLRGRAFKSLRPDKTRPEYSTLALLFASPETQPTTVPGCKRAGRLSGAQARASYLVLLGRADKTWRVVVLRVFPHVPSLWSSTRPHRAGLARLRSRPLMVPIGPPLARPSRHPTSLAAYSTTCEVFFSPAPTLAAPGGPGQSPPTPPPTASGQQPVKQIQRDDRRAHNPGAGVDAQDR